MGSWRHAIVLAGKDLRLIVRDKLTVFFIFGVPVLYGLFFGIISDSFRRNETHLRLGVIDHDRTKWSDVFLKGLGSGQAEVRLQRFKNRSQAAEAIRRGRVGHVVVIPRGFGETAGVFWRPAPKLVLMADPSRTAETGMVRGLVMEAIGKVAQARMSDSQSMKSALDEALQSLEGEGAKGLSAPLRMALATALKSFRSFYEKLPGEAGGEAERDGPRFEFVRLKTEPFQKHLRNASGAPLKNIRSGWDISIPQATLWGIFGCAASFAVSMVRERRWGTMLRLQAAPVSSGFIIIGKSLACFATVCTLIGVMFLLGMLLGMRPQSPLVLALAIPSIALSFVGIMMLMSLVGRSEESVSGAAWGANILMGMFGGGMIPLAFLPPVMQRIGYFDPARWAVLLMEGAIWRRFTLAEAMPAVMVLVGTGTAAIGLAALWTARNARRGAL